MNAKEFVLKWQKQIPEENRHDFTYEFYLLINNIITEVFKEMDKKECHQSQETH